MSKRHRPESAAQPPKVELRAHARGERHRINSELQRVANEVCSGLEPDDAPEPGAAWKPSHHHDAERARNGVGHRRLRHWKLKMWKRRTAARKAKAAAFRLAIDEA